MLSFHLLQNINWRSEVSSVFSSECSLKEKALVSGSGAMILSNLEQANF